MTRWRMIFTFLFLLSVTRTGIAGPQPRPKRTYFAARVDSLLPKIDGKLDDRCWELFGTWGGNFTQYIPREGGTASQKTEFKILYDDKYLYFAYRAFDTEPQKISPILARRDALVGDMGGFALDSYFNHRTAREFNMSAAGTKIDIAHLDNGSEWIWDTAWDAVYDGKSTLEDSAWTFEMRVPFSQLRFPRREDHIWGMHIWRWIHRLQEESQWQLLPRTGQGGVHYFGELHGISGIKMPKRIELLPYVRGQVETYQQEPGNPFKDGQNQEGVLGLDGKIGLGSNLTLDFTFNPDFGQVEADPSQVNLTAYETFFEERRPFFVEGRQSILNFETGTEMLYYSRRIGKQPSRTPGTAGNEHLDMPDNTTILNALKLTGRSMNGWVYGLLQSTTALEKAKIHNNGQYRRKVVEPLTNYALGRIQKEYHQGQTVIGGIFTAVNRKIDDKPLEFLPTAAYTGGIDIKHQFARRTWFTNLSLITSHLRGSQEAMLTLQQTARHYYQRPDADYVTLDSTRTTLSGTGGRLEIGKGAGKWVGSVRFGWLSPGLELNDLGYLREADILNQTSRFTYRQTDPVGLFRYYSVTATQNNEWNYNHDYIHGVLTLQTDWAFLSRHGGSLSVSRTDNALECRLLRGGPMVLGDKFRAYRYALNSNYSLPFQVSFSHNLQRHDNGGSKADNYSLSARWRITNALNVSSGVEYRTRSNDLQYVSTQQAGDVSRYILGRLKQETLATTFRINWSLTPDLTVQYYGRPFVSAGQYDTFRFVTQTRADKYHDRFQYYQGAQIITDKNGYQIDENTDGVPEYGFFNPDFNVREFFSNLVVRWEFKPGSSLYLVWSQNRNSWKNQGLFSARQDHDALFGVVPYNVFLMKMSYWFSI